MTNVEEKNPELKDKFVWRNSKQSCDGFSGNRESMFRPCKRLSGNLESFLHPCDKLSGRRETFLHPCKKLSRKLKKLP